MQSFFFVLALLVLVTIIYIFAYRMGYRDAQSRALLTVQQFSDPVTCLLDKLSASIDEAAHHEDEQNDDNHSTPGSFR